MHQVSQQKDGQGTERKQNTIQVQRRKRKDTDMTFIIVSDMNGLRTSILLDSIIIIKETTNGCIIETDLETIESSSTFNKVMSVITQATITHSIN